MHYLQVRKSNYTEENAVFRDLIKELRTKSGMTQADLAKELALPQSFVSKYETGERRLDLVEIRAVCQALDTSLLSFVKQFESRLLEKSKGGRA